MKFPINRSNARQSLWILYVIAATVALSASLSYRLGPDHGMMATVAQAFVDGGSPYSQAFDIKGPFSFEPFAVSEMLLGESQLGVRLADFALLVLALAYLVLTDRKLKRTHFVEASLIYWTIAIALGPDDSAQPDEWVGLLVLCMLASQDLFARFRTSRWLVAAGVFGALAALVKPFYVLYSVVAVLAVDRSTIPKRAKLIILGAVAGCAAVLLPYAIRASLGSFVDVHLVYSLFDYRLGDVGQRHGLVEGVRHLFWDRTIGRVILLSIPAALLKWNVRPLTEERKRPIAYLAVGVVCLLLGGRYFPYQFLPLLAPWILLITEAPSSHESGQLYRSGTVLQVVVTLAIAALGAAGAVRAIRNGSPSRYDDPGVERRNQLALKIARQVGQRRNVAYIGLDPTFIWLSGLRHSSPFVFSNPLTFGKDNSRRRAYRDRFQRGIEDHSTGAILIENEFRDAISNQETLHWIASLTNGSSAYVSCGSVMEIAIYLRREFSGGCSAVTATGP